MPLFPRKENLFRFENGCPIQRRFERGNHNADGLDYIVLRLDWVINILVKYSGTERIDPRVIDLLREVKDTIKLTSSQCPSSHAAGTV